MSRDEGQKNCFLEKTIFIELDSLKQNTSMFSHGPRAYVYARGEYVTSINTHS